MLKRTLTALVMVAMVASPASADLLVPNQVINPSPGAAAGTIGIFGASVNGSPVASPGFLGDGGVASQVSIPANPSDTIQVTFGFHWPFQLSSPLPILGVQFQNRLVYDNSEVRILGANGAGGFTSVNFAGNFMTATPGSATQIGISGTPLKGFPDPGTGIVSTAPGFGRFAVNPPNTTTVFIHDSTDTSLNLTTKGMFIPFSSTFPIMKVTLQAKGGVMGDNLVDLFVPPTSAFLLFRVLTTGFTLFTSNGASVMTVASHDVFFTGSQIGQTGGDFGVDVVPEPASAALMGIGLFCFVGGAWRRRRRIMHG